MTVLRFRHYIGPQPGEIETGAKEFKIGVENQLCKHRHFRKAIEDLKEDKIKKLLSQDPETVIFHRSITQTLCLIFILLVGGDHRFANQTAYSLTGQ